jgi:serine/threonine-protein kinase
VGETVRILPEDGRAGRGTKKLSVSPPEEDADLVGRRVAGRYDVEAVLGRGGMGTVFRARHTTLGKLFAIKLLRREIASMPEAVTRFFQEAKVTATIRHDHVVDVVDFGEITSKDIPSLGAATQPYFVMEHLEGESLAELLMREGPLDAARAAPIFRQVAEALAAAHDKGVVHRDLKPDNVFLLAGPGAPRVKVLDFGVARVLGAAKLTNAGTVFGTPYYMSPEQAAGDPVDVRSDQYALGVVMYEALSGRVPFDADDYMGVLTKHVFVVPEPIHDIVRDRRALGALGPIVMRCLEKRPECRYASASELARELGRIGPASVRPGAGASQAAERAPAQRRRTLIVAAAAVSVAVALVLGVAASRTPSEPASPAVQAPSSSPPPEPTDRAGLARPGEEPEPLIEAPAPGRSAGAGPSAQGGRGAPPRAAPTSSAAAPPAPSTAPSPSSTTPGVPREVW